MTVPSIGVIPGLQPLVHLGTFTSGIPTGEAIWAVAKWSGAGVEWVSGSGYVDPIWTDITCDVNSVEINTGRDRSIDRWQVGNATVTLNNESGWADIGPPSTDPLAFEVRPGRQIRFGVVVGSGTTTSDQPYEPGYLTPTVGTVTTPDPGPLPNPCTWVFKVRGPIVDVGHEHFVASQMVAAPQYGWALGWRNDGVFVTYHSGDGTDFFGEPYASSLPLADIDRTFGVTLDRGATTSTLRTQLYDGSAWNLLSVGPPATTTAWHDSTDPLKIGEVFGQFFIGRIYSVELRTGTDPAAGTVLWRFDADDYPGTGTSYVDPRGRTWTLTNEEAITPKVSYTPGIYTPPEPRWMYRWFIDSVEPSYEPVQEIDVVTVACVDAKGRAGKVAAAKTVTPVGAGDTADTRIHRTLDAVRWAPGARDLEASTVTLQETSFGSQVVDVMDRAADSSSGVVYGDAIGRIAYRAGDWQTWPKDDPPDAIVGNATLNPHGYLTPTTCTVTTQDPGPLPAEWTMIFKVRGPTTTDSSNALASSWYTYPNWMAVRYTDVGRLWFNFPAAGSGASQEMYADFIPDVAGDDMLAASARFSGPATFQVRRSVDNGATWTPVGTPVAANTVPRHQPGELLRIGAILNDAWLFDGRIYSVELRSGLDPAAGYTLWKFDADDYPGTGTSYVDPRGRTWTLTADNVITPKVTVADVCPVGWELSFELADVATQVHAGRSGQTPQVFDDIPSQVRYGVETFARTDLECTDDAAITAIGQQLLKALSTDFMPNVSACTVDAATSPAARDLCVTVDPTVPSRYHCRLWRRNDRVVFNRQFLAVGVQHRIDSAGWETRIALDDAAPYMVASPPGPLPDAGWDTHLWDTSAWT